jgi:flagellar hook protein FlgE
MSFQQGLSGLNISSKNLDVIGNNIANSSTVGFKASQAQFADVFAASLSGAGGSPVGLGAKVQAVAQQFTQGNITSTNNPLDVAINGNGFFIVSPPNTSTPFYSRNGQFSLDANDFVVTAEGYRVQGYPVDSAGTVLTGSAPADLKVSKAKISPLATGASTLATGVTGNINLNSSDPVIASAFDYTNTATYNHSTAATVYDSLGNQHTYTMYFQKSAVNTWKVYATITNPPGATTAFTDLSGGGVTAQQTLTFNTAGALTSASANQAVTAAQLGFPAGVAAMNFPVNFGGSTQYGSAFAVNSLSQDGYASGELASFSVGTDGVILGSYSNGITRNLGGIALANFANPQGLQPVGNNRWAATTGSGVPLVNTPGSGSNGVLQSSAVEDSNVDMTQELVSMITAQRVYQANAQTIKTQDQVLQTLVNLR